MSWTLRLTSLLLLALVGCGSTPVAGDSGTGASTQANLRVVVWSVRLQEPVPAVGTLTASTDGTERVLDTSSNPVSGQTFTGLPPGPYRLRIKFRKQGTSIEYVDGEGVVYLEPGVDETETVVVTDRKDDLGWAPPVAAVPAG